MRGIFGITFVACFSALLTVAQGQSYPQKPVTIVVSWPPGSSPDIFARILSPRLQQTFGKPFIVENKPGAGGVVAARGVLAAPPDGHTLLLADTPLMILAPHLVKNLGYEPLKAFRPISSIGRLPYVFASSASSRIKSIDDLIRVAKANPGKLNYGSPGVGTAHHIIMEAFKKSTGVEITHVPYKGATQLNSALISGEVDIAVTSIATLSSQGSMGAVNVLGVTTRDRFPSVPNVPAISEVVEDFDFTAEQGVVASAGVPDEIINRLAAAIGAALGDPEVQSTFRKLDVLPFFGGPHEYGASLRVYSEKYDKVIKAANIELTDP